MTKSKSVFPTDDSLFKMLYLAMLDITKKWTGRRQDWGRYTLSSHYTTATASPIDRRTGTAVSATGYPETKTAVLIDNLIDLCYYE